MLKVDQNESSDVSSVELFSDEEDHVDKLEVDESKSLDLILT